MKSWTLAAKAAAPIANAAKGLVQVQAESSAHPPSSAQSGTSASSGTELTKPLIVGIGGTNKPGSTTDTALTVALRVSEAAGARTVNFGGAFLGKLPPYVPGHNVRSAEQEALITAVRKADGLVIATPAYHGGISGLIKNALDLLEDLANDRRPYLEGRAVGCIVTAFGLQGAATTLVSLRSIVHALRGWPTPLGVTADTSKSVFANGECIDQKLSGQLKLVSRQVVDFASYNFTQRGW